MCSRRLLHPIQKRFSSSKKAGFIGLGKIGYAMASNMIKSGYELTVFDINKEACNRLEAQGCYAVERVEDVAKASSGGVLVSVLPNDQALRSVTEQIKPYLGTGSVHCSCSTVGPDTSRAMAKVHKPFGCDFVAAPFFARPDGMARGESYMQISGAPNARAAVKPLLSTTSKEIFDFGDDPGGANVAKLAGNFIIAAAIESMAEAMALAEKNGIDRVQLMRMLNTTIFDCLIYKGYGQRVSERDHFPYPDAHFALELGHKDINLVLDCAKNAQVPMPIASLLHQRFLTALAKGRSDLDWSAIGLNSAEDAGLSVEILKETNCD